MNRTSWTFADGIYDGVDDVFYPNGGIHSSESLMTAHAVDQPVSPYIDGAMDIPTPNIDRIIHLQLFQDMTNPTQDEKQTETMLWALMGRLFRDTNDTWEVCPVIVGERATGKSLLMHLIRSVYPPDRTAVVYANESFGLEPLVDKHILMVTDAKEMSQKLFRSMVRSEAIEVARKARETMSIKKWPIPMMWCTNTLPNWMDDETDHIVLFQFLKTPLHIDCNLPHLIHQELGRFIIKANKAYLHMRNLKG